MKRTLILLLFLVVFSISVVNASRAPNFYTDYLNSMNNKIEELNLKYNSLSRRIPTQFDWDEFYNNFDWDNYNWRYGSCISTNITKIIYTRR